MLRRCQHSSDLTSCGTGRFLIKLSVFCGGVSIRQIWRVVTPASFFSYQIGRFLWRCQHSSDLTNCDTGQFLDQIELFFVGMPNQATPGMKPGDTRDGTVRHPGMEPVDPGMEPVDTRNGTGRHPEWNRSTPGMEPASQFSFFSGQPGSCLSKLSKVSNDLGAKKSVKSVNFALSVEGVPVPCSVSATGPVSRDAQEFGISQACRF